MIKHFVATEALSDGARRLLGERVDTISDGLLRARDEPDAGLHAARKSIKNARALLKLLRAADPGFYATENARLRDLARSVAGARDAAAMVEACDRLIAARPDDARELAELRAVIAARRAALVVEDKGVQGAVDDGLRQCAQMRRDMDRWMLPDTPKPAGRLLAAGARHTLKRARKELRLADKRGRDEDFHELRKSVKAHRSQLGLLRDLWPESTARRRSRVEALGEDLGAHNDLALLRDLLTSQELELDDDLRKRVLAIAVREKAKMAANMIERAEKLMKMRSRKLETRFSKALNAGQERQSNPPRALGEPHV